MSLLTTVTYKISNAQSCPANVDSLTQAQHCEEGKGIKTNPNDLNNPECPNLANNFEWRIKNNLGTNPNEFYIVYDEDGHPKTLHNPFTDGGNSDYRFVNSYRNSNYHPIDGWELLKVEFGALSNFNTGWTQNSSDYPGLDPVSGGKKLPYMILYNKYTGTFRFFGSLLGQNDDYATVRIELRIPKRSPGDENDPSHYQNNLKATNLLSIQGDAVQPLDQETEENVMVVFATSPNNGSKFIWFDIPVAYDPCLCNIRSQLDITFAFIKTATMKLNGELDAALKTETKPDGTPYAIKVASSVLAAGVSTTLAIKTGGAVINFKAYADLINVIKDNPNSNLSQKHKDDLEQLANRIDCGAKFSRVVQKSWPDLNDKNEMKQDKGANDILEGGMTFMSSLTNGCQKVDNGATTINGAVHLSGTWTEELNIQGTEILLSIPGSNWSDFNRENHFLSPDNGLTIPAYPTYNERLGTFALLETPKIDVSSYWLGTNRHIYKVSPNKPHNIKYTFNPLINIDEEKSKIYFRFVIQSRNGIEIESNGWDGGVDEYINNLQFNNKNLNFMPSLLYPVTSPYLPLEYYSDFPGFVFIHKENNQNTGEISMDSIFIQFKIIMESHDLG